LSGPCRASSQEPHQGLIATLAAAQVLGGQVYDALIGLTAAEHGATLGSFDQRAALIYEAMGVRVEQTACARWGTA
jgi:hypothetical protein